ncbi:hypothetical protein [Lysobacter gummosus]|uniref:hypothetical protein n=1 Tax=Lysobacter gummosus TaxID=262324 RepID=UPI0036379D9E
MVIFATLGSFGIYAFRSGPLPRSGRPPAQRPEVCCVSRAIRRCVARGRGAHPVRRSRSRTVAGGSASCTACGTFMSAKTNRGASLRRGWVSD